MMRTLFFCSMLLFQVTFYHSQKLHQNLHKKDSIEFYSYFDKAYQLRSSKPDSAFYWVNKALEVAQKLANKEWLAKSMNLKGIIYYKKNEYLKSLHELENALKYTNNKELKGKIYINLANTLSDLNFPYSAIQYYQEAVRIFNSTHNYQFLIRALLNLATEEFNIGQKVNARNHLKLALYYAREYDLPEEEAICLNNISAIFIQSGLVDSASRYIYQSFNAYEKTENYFGLADAYLTAIELHLEKKEWDYAKALIDLADSIVNSIQYLEGKKILTSEKINYFLSVGELELSKKYFNEYLKLEDSLNIKKRTGDANISLPNNNEEKSISSSTSDIHFALLQLAVIFLIGIFICIFIVKNYRHVKK